MYAADWVAKVYRFQAVDDQVANSSKTPKTSPLRGFLIPLNYSAANLGHTTLTNLTMSGANAQRLANYGTSSMWMQAEILCTGRLEVIAHLGMKRQERQIT